MTNPNDPQQPGQWGPPQQNWGGGAGQPPAGPPPQYGPPPQQPPQYGPPQQQPQYGPPPGQGQYGPPHQGQYPPQQGQFPPQQGFGQQQGYGQPYGPPPKKNNTAVIWSIIVVIVLVGGGLGLYFGLKGDDTKGGTQANCGDVVSAVEGAIKNQPDNAVVSGGKATIPDADPTPSGSAESSCPVLLGKDKTPAVIATYSSSESDYRSTVTGKGWSALGTKSVNNTSFTVYAKSGDVSTGIITLTISGKLYVIYNGLSSDSGSAGSGSGGGAGGGVGASSASPS